MSQTTPTPPTPVQPVVPEALQRFYAAITRDLGPDFKLQKGGIAFHDRSGRDQPPFCSPFRVRSRLWNSVAGWSLVLEILNPRDEVVPCVIAAEVLDGRPREAMGALAKSGLRVFSAEFHRTVLDLIRGWPVRLFETEVRRTGWTEERSAFGLPTGDVLVRKGISERFRYTGEPTSVAVGDLSIWKSGVAALCPGNPVLLFACSVAFAAPLLPFQKATGSRIFHFHGLSGDGKTLLLKVASTVWGKRRAGIRTWRTTVNGLEAAAAEVQHLLLCLDDLPEEPPAEFDAAIYMVGNDGGKTRMNELSKLQARLTWLIMVLSSGEVPSSVALKGLGKTRRGGQSVRMIDIRVADRKDAKAWSAYENLHGHATGRAFVAALDRAVDQAAGPAGAAFVEFLLRMDPTALAAKLTASIEDAAYELRARFGISEDDPDQTEVRRVLDSFAVVAVAGEWATGLRVTGWEKGSVTEAVAEIAGRWLQERGGAGPVDQMEAVKATREFLDRNATRLIPLPVRNTGQGLGREILGYRDESYFYLLSQTFAEINKGRDIDVSARLLEAAGHLVRGGERNSLLYRVPKAGDARPRAYRISRSILDA